MRTGPAPPLRSWFAPSIANAAMLACGDFRNRKVREALEGSQATEDQNRNLNKRVRFYWNRNLEERVKFRCQVARPPYIVSIQTI